MSTSPSRLGNDNDSWFTQSLTATWMPRMPWNGRQCNFANLRRGLRSARTPRTRTSRPGEERIRNWLQSRGSESHPGTGNGHDGLGGDGGTSVDSARVLGMALWGAYAGNAGGIIRNRLNVTSTSVLRTARFIIVGRSDHSAWIMCPGLPHGVVTFGCKQIIPEDDEQQQMIIY